MATTTTNTSTLEGSESHSKTQAEHHELQFHSESEAQISTEHRQFLMERHGTVHLEPLPSQDPADPLNWPAWKKNTNLALVALHGLVSTGGAVAVVPAFETWSIKFDVSIATASYLGSAQMITLALGPLLWLPIANRYGRRPVWIISTFGGGLFNIACALSNTYGLLISMRILQAFFISPGIAMGQAVVAESFFTHERAQKMGIWALMITIGTPMGPFAMGFVVQHLSWRWMFWIMAIINFAHSIGYLFLGPETLYNRDMPTISTAPRTAPQKYFGIHHIAKKPVFWHDFLLPFQFLADYRVLTSAAAYTITFNFTLVLLTVEIPSFFIPLFHFNAQQVGLNFLGLFAGCVLGELVGGPLSDLWQNYFSKRANGIRAAPEKRLWLSYPGFVLSIVGLVIFCVTLAEAEPMHWNIRPIVGVGVAGFGVQIVTTIVITYCSDCYHELKSPALGAAINLIRCTWGFIGPFWFPYMFDSCGLRGSAGIMAGVIFTCSILPIVVIHYLSSRKAKAAI